MNEYIGYLRLHWDVMMARHRQPSHDAVQIGRLIERVSEAGWYIDLAYEPGQAIVCATKGANRVIVLAEGKGNMENLHTALANLKGRLRL